MMENEPKDILDKQFWEDRWKSGNTGWDIGYASPAITGYMSNCADKNCRILIPGCGNAYEAEFLVNSGFKNITLVDISPTAADRLRQKFVDSRQISVMCSDFFLHEGNYDIVIEQTFFCTHPPRRRAEYASKVASLLNPNGRIIGVLFGRKFDWDGPPFGGEESDYRKVFEPLFTVHKMESCYNSISSRANSELFINLVKK